MIEILKSGLVSKKHQSASKHGGAAMVGFWPVAKCRWTSSPGPVVALSSAGRESWQPRQISSATYTFGVLSLALWLSGGAEMPMFREC